MAGRLVYFEFPADDTERAREFWSALFGWRFRPFEGPIEYHSIEDGDPGGAIYSSQSGERGPIVYFDVDDVDSAVGRVRELGGKAEDKSPIPGIGWFARAEDSEGNAFSLYQEDSSAGEG